MKILAVDTSSQTLTVALKNDSYYQEFNSPDNAMQHSQTLMPKIIQMCNEANIQTSDIDLFVCTRGPGSFTGLRIGMAALKGLAFGGGKDLVSVSTLLTFANCINDFDGAVISALDAKKNRYYLAAFEIKNRQISRIMQDTDGNVADLDAVLKQYSKILVVGPDAQAFAQIMQEHFGLSKHISVATQYSQSIGNSLIELATKQYKEKGADDIGQGPVYLRKSDAEQALEDKIKAEKQNG